MKAKGKGQGARGKGQVGGNGLEVKGGGQGWRRKVKGKSLAGDPLTCPFNLAFLTWPF